MKIEIETTVASHKELEELLGKIEEIEKRHSQENSYTLKKGGGRRESRNRSDGYKL